MYDAHFMVGSCKLAIYFYTKKLTNFWCRQNSKLKPLIPKKKKKTLIMDSYFGHKCLLTNIYHIYGIGNEFVLCRPMAPTTSLVSTSVVGSTISPFPPQ